MPLHRLRSDFRLGILVVFGAVIVFGITPFAIYRLLQGQYAAGVLDLAIVAAIAAGTLYAFRGGDVDRAAMMVVACYTLGAIAVTLFIGRLGVLWLYVILMVNYLVLRPGHAMLASGIALVAVVGAAWHAGGLAGGVELAAVLVTTLLVNLFSYIFARRTEYQRERLEELASRDPLTGAYNRRALERELQIALEGFRRHGPPYGVAVIDIDHFKAINDSRGHEGGDAVLVDFVALVRRHVRKGDRFFRYGGEEFVLLLPGVDEDGLHHACEKVRAAVEAELRAGESPVTVSIGATRPRPTDDNGAAWLARADAALYRAKREGRNRVVLAGPDYALDVAPAA